ncbi:unnamed protein product [Pedinophyceae sp. YPF-701]|nr:unnamed protein product [Pedinophyceae sp. YPF-701]
MTDRDVLTAHLTRLKDEGNARFTSRDYEGAEQLYSQAIEAAASAPGHRGTHPRADLPPQTTAVLAVVHSNRAQARLNAGRLMQALLDCESTLALLRHIDHPAVAAAAQRPRAKALHRKALVLRKLGLCAYAEACERARDGVAAPRQQQTHAAARSEGCHAPGAGVAAEEALHVVRAPRFDPGVVPREIRRGYVFDNPEDTPDCPNNILLLLHGAGDSARNFASLASRIRLPNCCTLALQGPMQVPLLPNSYAFHDFLESDMSPIVPEAAGRRRTDALQRARLAMEGLVAGLQGAGWRREGIHVFGYGQGGTLALELARSLAGAAGKGERVLGSVAVVAASLLPEDDEVASEMRGGGGAAEEARAGCGWAPVVITHGERDGVVKRAWVDASAAVLRGRYGCKVEVLTVRDKGNGMVGEGVRDGGRAEKDALLQFWARWLLQRAPKGTVEVQPPGR